MRYCTMEWCVFYYETPHNLHWSEEDEDLYRVFIIEVSTIFYYDLLTISQNRLKNEG